jgi:hypothetical protein
VNYTIYFILSPYLTGGIVRRSIFSGLIFSVDSGPVFDPFGFLSRGLAGRCAAVSYPVPVFDAPIARPFGFGLVFFPKDAPILSYM